MLARTHTRTHTQSKEEVERSHSEAVCASEDRRVNTTLNCEEETAPVTPPPTPQIGNTNPPQTPTPSHPPGACCRAACPTCDHPARPARCPAVRPLSSASCTCGNPACGRATWGKGRRGMLGRGCTGRSRGDRLGARLVGGVVAPAPPQRWRWWLW